MHTSEIEVLLARDIRWRKHGYGLRLPSIGRLESLWFFDSHAHQEQPHFAASKGARRQFQGKVGRNGGECVAHHSRHLQEPRAILVKDI
ncbi:hypothetical protein DVT68_00280 [Dyella solisilvae]|uniref:Uncharacterized protein n=1 Tax=Dyella solisilvae TaxID=1920168 RepID=A0A370K9N1_9GAMM|nr:hypothetical protein DVT68_00280 [Dyella solisilvae]